MQKRIMVYKLDDGLILMVLLFQLKYLSQNIYIYINEQLT